MALLECCLLRNNLKDGSEAYCILNLRCVWLQFTGTPGTVMFSGVIGNIRSQLVKAWVLLFWKPWGVTLSECQAGVGKQLSMVEDYYVILLHCFINITKKKMSLPLSLLNFLVACVKNAEFRVVWFYRLQVEEWFSPDYWIKMFPLLWNCDQ